VRDTGTGIAADMLDRVFDLFVQADSTLDRSSRGIGVGLTLVRSIVELHRGSVKAYSDGPGKGSEFVVRLPLVRTAVRAEQGSDGVAQSAAALRGREVLIVEDDDDIRETLQAILKNDGMRVRAVADGPEALEALEGGLPAVALLDIGLPGMSGYELARAIRQKHGPDGVRLVALTGFGQVSDRQAAREAGFDAHLTKPLKPNELYRALGSLLGGSPNGHT
jgi:two-component system, chemotaxis family, CheB/CheR fusion protein